MEGFLILSAGIDLGTKITGGVLLAINEVNSIIPLSAMSFSDKSKQVGIRACVIIDKLWDNFINQYKVNIVVAEYPFGIAGHGAILKEMYGMLRYKLYQKGIPLVTPTQSQIKLYATGKGNAQKSELVLRLYKEFKIEYPTEDQVDAFWMAHMGLSIAGYRPIEKYRQALVEKLKQNGS